MAENRPKPLNPAPPLNDVDYFDYFKSQKDGRVYDDFGQSWEKFDIKLFDSITHYNILQVYKFMVNKRIEHFKRYDSLSKVAKEKDQKIKAFEKQKLEADNKERMENTKLKIRIKELEDLWKQKSDDGKIVELEEEINQLKADIENKRSTIQKYRERRDSDKNQLKENRENLKKADAEIKELKSANRKLESDLIAANNSMKQLENRNKNLKSDLNAANESIKIFQINQNEKAEETQNEMNQLKANFNAKNMKLKNVLIHLKSVKKELTKIKQKCQSYEESNEQQSEIIEQLQKALTCSSDQNEKLKDDLLAAQNALKKLKDGKTTALNEIAKSLKDCGNLKKSVTKTLPSKKELIERSDALEAENKFLKEKNEELQFGLNANANQYRLLFDENLQLKIDLVAAEKRRKKLDKRNEGSRKRSKDREQQNGNGEASKRAKHNEIDPAAISPLAAQQFTQRPVTCSPPNLSPQASRQGPQSSNNGFQQSHPNLMNKLIQPPTNLPFQTFFSAQMHPSIIQRHHQQQQQMILMMQQQHQQQQQQRNGLNPPPNSGNPSMTNNPRQQQQQLPSPNSIPELFPPNLNHFQNQQIPTGQMFFRNFQPQVPPGFMVPPPPSFPQLLHNEQQLNNSR